MAKNKVCENDFSEKIELPNILNEAQYIVDQCRRQEYGDPGECFGQIAKMWSAYTGCEINIFDVANMMILLKVCRANGNGFQRDSYLDIAGYAYCAENLNKSIF